MSITAGAAADLPDVLPAVKPRGRLRTLYRRYPTVVLGGALLAFIIFLAVAAPILWTVDPTALAPAKRTRPPSELYWFGTDMLGRDIYSRTLYGARVSLIVGFAVAFLSSVVGMLIGVCAGYIRIIDAVVMRVMDGLMSIPSILLAIALMALTRGSVQNVIIAITVAEIPRVTRLVRGVVLSLREQPYVEAAVASGTRTPWVILKHILPNTLAPIMVQATFICASAMITEAILSFIGAGTPPIIPSWGNIMAEGRALWQVKPFIVFFPALFLSLTVLAVNLLGDGLRDALDPVWPSASDGAARRPTIADPFRHPGRCGARRRGPVLPHRCRRDRRHRGESGCGKSVTSMSILRLVNTPPGKMAGQIMFNGRDLLKLPEAEMRKLRGNDISMIFQEPMTSLNPVLTVGRQIGEALELHQGMDRKAATARAVEMLELVGISAAPRRVKEYPHQLSGGMRQRVMIAMALACNPKLLIADEPTTALDVTIQAQILDLMRDLKTRLGSAIMLITHDLGVVAEMAERVIVMYAGRKVEEATVGEIFARPCTPTPAACWVLCPGWGRHWIPTRAAPSSRKFPAWCRPCGSASSAVRSPDAVRWSRITAAPLRRRSRRRRPATSSHAITRRPREDAADSAGIVQLRRSDRLPGEFL